MFTFRRSDLVFLLGVAWRFRALRVDDNDIAGPIRGHRAEGGEGTGQHHR